MEALRFIGERHNELMSKYSLRRVHAKWDHDQQMKQNEIAWKREQRKCQHSNARLNDEVSD